MVDLSITPHRSHVKDILHFMCETILIFQLHSWRPELISLDSFLPVCPQLHLGVVGKIRVAGRRPPKIGTDWLSSIDKAPVNQKEASLPTWVQERWSFFSHSTNPDSTTASRLIVRPPIKASCLAAFRRNAYALQEEQYFPAGRDNQFADVSFFFRQKLPCQNEEVLFSADTIPTKKRVFCKPRNFRGYETDTGGGLRS
jgi:hypothetical protein